MDFGLRTLQKYLNLGFEYGQAIPLSPLLIFLMCEMQIIILVL